MSLELESEELWYWDHPPEGGRPEESTLLSPQCKFAVGEKELGRMCDVNRDEKPDSGSQAPPPRCTPDRMRYVGAQCDGTGGGASRGIPVCMSS